MTNPHSTSLRDAEITRSARLMIAHSSLSLLDCTRLVLELLESTGYNMRGDTMQVMRHCREVIQDGVTLYCNKSHTLPFDQTVDHYLKSKLHLRGRTFNEMRQYYYRILRENEELRQKPLRDFTPEDCNDIIKQSFKTPSTQRKALCLLRSLFSFGQIRCICNNNPVRALSLPRIEEKRISPLTLKQVQGLLKTTELPEYRCCGAAVGLMLWAGVRPTEVTRIKWKHINFQDKVIELHPTHAKTGGARLITLHSVLTKWLRRINCPIHAENHIIPRSWTRRWRDLRQAAGFKEWHADILRHTYASYHLRHFKNLQELQLNMGHSSTNLLRTRYLSMSGLSAKAAAVFWGDAAANKQE